MSSFVKAFGDIQDAQTARVTGDYNAGIMRSEGQASIDQSAQEEAQTRQTNREALGKQAAAIGAAGIGYGGSSSRVQSQSATNLELNALNQRYRGQFTRYGYMTQANLDEYEGKQRQKAGYLKAGADTLQGAMDLSGSGALA